MVVIVFRSRLTSEAGQDYRDLDAEMERLVLAQSGYLSHKSYLRVGRRAADAGLVPGPGIAPQPGRRNPDIWRRSGGVGNGGTSSTRWTWPR